MTDQFKEITKVKVLDAMIAEGLTNKEAAEAIGIQDNYLSMIKHPDQWPKCPAQAWVKTVNWLNSGQTLREYAVKHGKVRPDPEPTQKPPTFPADRIEKDQRYCWQCQYADLDKWEVTYKTYCNMTSADIEALKSELLEENIILRDCIKL